MASIEYEWSPQQHTFIHSRNSRICCEIVAKYNWRLT